MNRDQFRILCTQAAICLGLESDSFDACAVAEVHGIDTQITFSELSASAYVFFELGRPRPGLESEVHRELLELQCLFAGVMDAMFTRDPVNDLLVFSVRTPLHTNVSADRLAEWMTVMAGQVRDWRETLLAGKLDAADAADAAAAAGFVEAGRY